MENASIADEHYAKLDYENFDKRTWKKIQVLKHLWRDKILPN
jgi:hypothetical protein